MTKRRGEFEACFAGGLDLSELTTTPVPTTTSDLKSACSNNNNNNKMSHAANLLRIKQAEAAVKLESEKEEIILQNLITTRSEQLKHVVTSNTKIAIPTLPAPTNHSQQLMPVSSNPLTKNSHCSGSNMIHTVLVGMHGESNQRGYDNMPRKMLMKRNSNNTSKGSKKGIAKKSIRRKF